MIVAGRTLTGEVTWDADVAIVGTGAGGSPVGHALAKAGKNVVMLEAGPSVALAEMNQRVPDMLARLYWDRGARVTSNGAFTVSQGRVVGGSTVHYTAWAMRPPRPILDHWAFHLKITDLDAATLDPLVAEVERMLSTRPVLPHEVNAHNHLVESGAAKLGLSGGFVHHNRIGCLGCGYCLLGCAYDRKQTMANTFLPAAMASGARVVSDAHVERLLTRGARVEGVRARLGDGARGEVGTLTVRAPIVVLASGAIHSPLLLTRSGIGDASGQVGRNLVFHTTTTMFGRFDDEVFAHRGFAPSYVVDHFVDLERHPDRGYFLVPAFAPPAAIAPFLPGFGDEHANVMRSYTRLAGLSVMLHDSSRGRVTMSATGRPVIDYALDAVDRGQILEGMMAAGRLLFAAGAKEVYPSSPSAMRFTSPDQLEHLTSFTHLENRFALNTPHPQGTCRMGESRQDSVVDPWGRSHDVAGLYVSDMSVFPTSIAVPPSMTTAVLALRTAAHILATA